MITVSCREETYRYNSFHMLKAFFPYEEVTSTLQPDQAEVIKAADSNKTIAAVYSAASKNDAERQLYAALKKQTGQSLPWGVLMGVRPTKPAMTALKKGISEDAFIRSFREEKLVSAPKAALAWLIAQREKKIIDGIEQRSGDSVSETFSLYIGIPFCPSICSYCSFSAGTLNAWSDRVDAYLDALCSELENTAASLKNGVYITESGLKVRLNPRPVSVYIGGGTPTSLSEVQLARLMKCLKDNFHPEESMEYTLEAGRPDSITEQKLKVARDHGITRLSINPQTMQQKTLDLVGRGHTVEQIYTAFEMARELGFDNINMDLIAGLPEEGCDEMDDTLQQIRSLSPDSLTVHALAIKRTSKMAGQCVDGKTVVDMIDMARQAAAAMDLEPYYLYRQKSIAGNLENTGYARAGCEGIYNILMMEEVQSIIGCGAGTKTKILLSERVPDPKRGGDHMTNILHSSDPKAPDAYIRRFCEDKSI